MQRYSDGLAVPKLMVDTFFDPVSDAAGFIYLTLTYMPKSIDHIVQPLGVDRAGGRVRFYVKSGLVGKVLELNLVKIGYEKTDTPTGNANSGGSGADPHGHALSYMELEAPAMEVLNETQRTIAIHYVVA